MIEHECETCGCHVCTTARALTAERLGRENGRAIAPPETYQNGSVSERGDES